MKKKLGLLLAGSVVVLLAGCSKDGGDTIINQVIGDTYTLYFSQDSNGNGLYSIDTTTGVATIVGLGISGISAATLGIAPNDSGGYLYSSKPSGIMQVFKDGSGFIDLAAGATQEALAYDNENGILYGCLNGICTTMNTTTGAVATTLTAPGVDVEGLAFDTSTGNIWALVRTTGELMLYNVAGDSWSTIGATGLTPNAPGLAYHPLTGQLFALSGSAGSIYTINKSTGTATLVGAHGLGNVGGGLAFAVD